MALTSQKILSWNSLLMGPAVVERARPEGNICRLQTFYHCRETGSPLLMEGLDVTLNGENAKY